MKTNPNHDHISIGFDKIEAILTKHIPDRIECLETCVEMYQLVASMLITEIEVISASMQKAITRPNDK